MLKRYCCTLFSPSQKRYPRFSEALRLLETVRYFPFGPVLISNTSKTFASHSGCAGQSSADFTLDHQSRFQHLGVEASMEVDGVSLAKTKGWRLGRYFYEEILFCNKSIIPVVIIPLFHYSFCKDVIPSLATESRYSPER